VFVGVVRFALVGESLAMFLARYLYQPLVRACQMRRLRAVVAIGFSAPLLGGCFIFEDGRRSFFDHAHYAPIGGQADDIFLEPIGHMDRTIPNRLGRLDVAPTNYSFETDQAARARAKLTLPPQPVIPPVPKVAPQSGAQPGSLIGPQTGAQAAPSADAPPSAVNRTLRQRSPARPVAPGVTPGVEIAPPTSPPTQSAAPTLSDPVAGVVPPRKIAPVEKAWPVTITPTTPPKI
jgi:hypothetical protein